MDADRAGHRSDERTEAVRSLESEFGALIAQFRRVLSENAERVSPGMLPGAYKVFTTIVREGSTTPSALAEKLMADKGLVSRAVRELEAKGLIERAPDPSDGRSIVLTPTDDGLARLAAARAPQEAAMLDALESWTVDDIRTLSRLLRALSSGSQP